MHDNSLNFTFPLEYVSFQVSMVSTGRMVQSIPAHAHGRGCYEIHYIRHGSGTVVIDGVPRRVGQNTLIPPGLPSFMSRFPIRLIPWWNPASICAYSLISKNGVRQLPRLPAKGPEARLIPDAFFGTGLLDGAGYPAGSSPV